MLRAVPGRATVARSPVGRGTARSTRPASLAGRSGPGQTRRVRRYRSFIADSTRWDGFAWRDDDVVVCTPAKCGTTWMQQVALLLVHDETELDQPQSVLSPWLDMLLRSRDEVFSLLEAQPHRRVIKTHTPVDGLPLPEGPTVLHVTRHPLISFASFVDHRENMADDRVLALRAEAVGLEDLADLPPPLSEEGDDPRTVLRRWLDADLRWGGTGMDSLADHVHHTRVARAAADERPGQVHLFHFDDLRADLAGQVRRVAGILGIEPGPRFGDQVAALGADAMRASADRIAPDADRGTWVDAARFFRTGGRRGLEGVHPDDLARYDERMAELADTDLRAWIEHGSGQPAATT